ncbi:hypothetical protein BJV78DRAFT_548713 [Lactifluus subvellereus]|nr:hypothetical protein BJV78DRAFT_548713 [Lactifluus subvellereus]
MPVALAVGLHNNRSHCSLFEVPVTGRALPVAPCEIHLAKHNLCMRMRPSRRGITGSVNPASAFQPSRDSQVTSSHQQPVNTFAPSSQYYDSRHGDPQYPLPSHAPLQAASFERHNDAQTHIPLSDSGHSRRVPSSYPSHGSPPRQRQGISVPSNPLYTSHPQSERRGQQDYPQPHWQQQHSSPPRSADPQYSDFGHTSAPSQPSRPQYTSPQGSYTSPSQPVAHYNTQRSSHQYIGTHPIPPNHDIQTTAGQSTHTRSYNVPGEGNPVPSTWGYTPQSVPAVPSTSTQSSLSVVGRM